MRVSRKHLLALPAAVGVAFAVAGASATAAPPGAGYGWNQPGCAPVAVPCAQPPASAGAVPAGIATPARGSDYAWAQPETAPVEVPFGQPPAVVPA